MLLVAAWLAPRFLSIQVLPVVGLVTSTTAVGVPEQCTVPAAYCDDDELELTINVKLPVCPPILIAKLAVPLVVGVPVMVYVKVPLPLAKVPEAKVAVKPVTPVEVIV